MCAFVHDHQIVCSVTFLCLVRQNFVPHILDAVSSFTLLPLSIYQNLLEYCVKYIAGHMKLVLQSQGFRQLDPFVLQKLMTSLAPYDVFKT